MLRSSKSSIYLMDVATSDRGSDRALSPTAAHSQAASRLGVERTERGARDLGPRCNRRHSILSRPATTATDPPEDFLPNDRLLCRYGPTRSLPTLGTPPAAESLLARRTRAFIEPNIDIRRSVVELREIYCFLAVPGKICRSSWCASTRAPDYRERTGSTETAWVRRRARPTSGSPSRRRGRRRSVERPIAVARRSPWDRFAIACAGPFDDAFARVSPSTPQGNRVDRGDRYASE